MEELQPEAALAGHGTAGDRASSAAGHGSQASGETADGNPARAEHRSGRAEQRDGGVINTWSRGDFQLGMGLLFALLGARVTFVELACGRADFVSWRYKTRGLNVQSRILNSAGDFAEFEAGTVDLMVATEIFEHVRNPLRLLQIIATALRPGGLLFDSMGGQFDRDAEGDHLEEAICVGNSQAYIRFYEAEFLHLRDTPGQGRNFLFERRRSCQTYGRLTEEFRC